MRTQLRVISTPNMTKVYIAIIAIILASASYFFIENRLAHAVSIDYVALAPTVAVDSERSAIVTDPLGCHDQSVLVGNDTTPHAICIYQAKDFTFGVYNYCRPSMYSGCNNELDFVIGFSSDPRMYRVEGIPGVRYGWIASEETNTIFYSLWNSAAFTISDILHHITSISATDGVAYSYDGLNRYDLSPIDENSGYVPIIASGFSANGEWAAFEMKGKGLVRVHLTDRSYTLYTQSVVQYGYGSDPSYGFAISNDGRFIADFGNNVPKIEIYDLNGCGDTQSSIQSYWHNGQSVANMCPSRDISTLISQANGGISNQSYSNVSFNYDGAQLSLIAHPYTNSYNIHDAWVTVTASGYTPAPRLDYLALGDSYSSGEGDFGSNINGSSHYLPGTNNISSNAAQNELCHISDVSYPFLLAKNMGLSSDYFKSVACSGAKTADIGDLSNSDSVYDGQPNSGVTGRLSSRSNEATLKSDALISFIPGRDQQIEFVKKYQPKVITLTAGGNDVDFAGVVHACVTPAAGTIQSSTCDYASDDIFKARLGQSIQGMYSKLVKLYTDIYKASGYKSRIYVVGYPQFVDDQPSNVTCGLNVRLDNTERTMIREGVNYLNSVIQNAAASAGVKYIDVQDSLAGHELCDQNPAVNGISSFFDDGKGTQAGSFHPNEYGQSLIAQYFNNPINNLNGSSLLNYNYCSGSDRNTICPDSSITEPTMPSYFADPSNTTGIRYAVYRVVTDAAIAYGVIYPPSLVITLPALILNPNNPANIAIYSNEESLGSFTPSSDGSLSASVTLPNDLSLGYHTIVITGTSPTGQSVSYWQIIEVHGTDSNDFDGNGIPDSQQSCVGLQDSGIDRDFDGIDDACDPYINPSSQAYRARLGDSTRTYNGYTENPSYIFIERNVHAQSVTGVIGDYDPDGDGWAIVGVSAGKTDITKTVPETTAEGIPDTGPIANFIVSESGSTTTPYLYIRTANHGCVELTPKNLLQVKVGRFRTLKVTAKNANKCRQEVPSADVNGDGIPDNTQTLYMARKGDPAIQHTKPDGVIFNEDPNKLYIFRNFYAAEAQLGISDYSPTGTTAGNADQPIQVWNLLASNQGSQTIPAYDNLSMIQDINGDPMPVILTKKPNGQCVAYEPANTNSIKMNTQYARRIIKLSSVPQGVSCD
jgi:lysophospholipase L1-like esterase